jgi:hypothetical protein
VAVWAFRRLRPPYGAVLAYRVSLDTVPRHPAAAPGWRRCEVRPVGDGSRGQLGGKKSLTENLDLWEPVVLRSLAVSG